MSFSNMASTSNQSLKRKVTMDEVVCSPPHMATFTPVKRIHIPSTISTPSMSEVSTAASSLLPTPAEDHFMDEADAAGCMLQQPSFDKPINSNSLAAAAGNNTGTLSPIARPSTPPLGMTLSHYDASTGSYMSSQLNSDHEVKSPICTGMTTVYRPPFERWGSCLI